MKQLILLTAILISLRTYSQSIIITEIMPDPSKVTDVNGEWFEIWNETFLPIDINGWSIRDSGVDNHVINNGGPLIIPSGNFLVLMRNGDNAMNGGLPAGYTYSGFILANDTDEIMLFDASNNLIDEVQYFKASAGKSFSLDSWHFNSTDNDSMYNWCSTSAIYGLGDFGTPGIMNSQCITSLEEKETTVTSIYYDPATTQLNIYSDHRNVAWQLTNVLGEKILAGTNLPDALSMQIYPQGIYFLQIDNSQYKFLRY